MTKTDLFIQKDQEIKRLNDELTNLKEKINNLNISLGSKDEVLKSKVKELEKELELAKDQQKVIIRKGERITYICSSCGYNTPVVNENRYCPNCGKNYSMIKSTGGEIYKNLDSEIAELQTAVEKKIKKTVADLENIQLNLEIKIESLENELKRKDKRHNSEVDDLQFKNLDRINKYREEVKELEQQINDIKKGKDKETLEQKRKEEVEKLKEANKELVNKLAEAEKLGFWRKLFRKIFVEREARKQAIKSVLLINQLNEKLENTWQNNQDLIVHAF